MARRNRARASFVVALASLLSAGPALAQSDALNSGDTAWILVATALVLFMTIPGLALFYGGLVRVKNVLSVLMQCLALTSAVTIVLSAPVGRSFAAVTSTVKVLAAAL